MFHKISDDNYELFAMKHYDNPSCQSRDEFYEDLNRTKYIKRLLRRYLQGGDLRERLILNHLIIFYNVFGIDAATRMLFFKLEEECHSPLLTFLVYLNYIDTENPPMGMEVDIISIPLDPKIIKVLRSL